MLELLLIGAQLAQQVASGYGGNLTVDAGLALDGYLGDGSASEIRVVVSSGHRQRVRLATSGGSPDVELRLDLEPGSPVTTWLPVYPDFSGAPLRLAAYDENGAVLLSTKLDYVPVAGPLHGLLGAGVTAVLATGADAIPLDASAMPHFTPAYGQLAVLAADASALARLDNPQLAAFADYLARCGRLVVLDAGPRSRQQFAAQAGCSGRYLRFVDNPALLLTAYRELAAMPGPARPTSAELAAVIAATSGTPIGIRFLQLWLPASLLLFVLLLKRPERRVTALAFALFAALLVPVAWSPGPSRSTLTWAEAAAGQDTARYVTLTSYVAARHAEFELPVAAGARLQRSAVNDRVVLRWAPEQAARRYAWQAAALDGLAVEQSGQIPVTTSLRAARNNGTVVVCNTGSAETLSALLHYDGRLHVVPPLDPGASWQLAGHEPLAGDSPEARLFRQRAISHPVALLFELPDAENAWLLRYETNGAGSSPC
jgi:hypothetical protein